MSPFLRHPPVLFSGQSLVGYVCDLKDGGDEMSGTNRRDFLHAAGLAGMLSGVSPAALAQGASGPTGAATIDPANTSTPEIAPTHHIKFSAIGLDHAHIYGMTRAVQRGGGELVSFYAKDPAQVAEYRKQFGDVKLASSEEEILADKSVQLVLGAPIPDLRAPLGIRVMQAGKDYLSDKPGITSLEQLAAVRKAIKDTRRKFAIMYSERLEVRAAVHAGDLIQQGAIGKVVQTVNLAPHRVNAPSRPAWFFDKTRYGGILCDIGSHQADQFVYYTNSTQAHVVAAQTGNFAWPQYPKFEDFGDMVMTGNGGTGYVRVDWFTPDGLDTWGDGRLFVLGTEGYIELRKYTNVAVAKGGNHLFIVDKKSARYIDCNNVPLPFGPQFVRDVVERTEVAQNQAQALLATELVLTAQKIATKAQTA
jgi:predicted dehydrogenase